MFADIAAAQPLRVLSLRYFSPIGADRKMRTRLQPRRPTRALGNDPGAHGGVPFVITGTGWPTRSRSGLRDYIHTWDLAATHVAALTRFDTLPAPAGTINLGTGTTVRELLDMFNRLSDRPVQAREAGPPPDDAASAYTRTDQAARLLAWRPQYNLTDSIRHSLQRAALRDESCPPTAQSGSEAAIGSIVLRSPDPLVGVDRALAAGAAREGCDPNDFLLEGCIGGSASRARLRTNPIERMLQREDAGN